MSHHSKATGFHPVRHDRLLQENRHDTYRIRGKLAEPTVCPGCGAVFHEGRWQWIPRPAQAAEQTCPACNRIADELPAGFVHLSGAFFADHREEVVHLINNTAARESAERPLERLMAMTAANGGMLITTTGIHLARRLGEALHSAYQGDLEYHYNEEEMLLRVHWQR